MSWEVLLTHEIYSEGTIRWTSRRRCHHASAEKGICTEDGKETTHRSYSWLLRSATDEGRREQGEKKCGLSASRLALLAYVKASSAGTSTRND